MKNSSVTFYNLVKYWNIDKTDFDTGFHMKSLRQSFITEFKYLYRRQLVNYFRNPQLLKSRIFVTIFFTLFPTILYWNIAHKHEPPEFPYISDPDRVISYIFNINATVMFLGSSTLFTTMYPIIGICIIEK